MCLRTLSSNSSLVISYANFGAGGFSFFFGEGGVLFLRGGGGGTQAFVLCFFTFRGGDDGTQGTELGLESLASSGAGLGLFSTAGAVLGAGLGLLCGADGDLGAGLGLLCAASGDLGAGL